MALYVVSMMLLIVGAAALPAQEMLPDSAGVMHPVATTNTGGPDATVDNNCFSISAGASDFWCQTSCGTSNPAACPTTVCQCGEMALPVVKQPLAAQAAQETQAAQATQETQAAPAAQAAPDALAAANEAAAAAYEAAAAAQPAAAVPATAAAAAAQPAAAVPATAAAPAAVPDALTAANEAAAAAAAEATNPMGDAGGDARGGTIDNRNWGGNASCVSIATGIGDYWCATTCTIPEACPTNKCNCGSERTMEKLKDAEKLKANSCDFDKQGCIALGSMKDCRPCAAHVVTCMATSHKDKEGNTVAPYTYQECLDEVSVSASDGCSKCNTTDSKEAYKVRMGYPVSEQVARFRVGWFAVTHDD